MFICTGISPSVAVDTVNKTTMPSFNGKTLYVGGIGGGNYTRIQDAIDNTSDGNTVFVYDDSSPYEENVVVYTSINLIGENRDTTVIDGNGIDSVIQINVDRVTISNFTVQNCGYSGKQNAGIENYGNYNTISKNIIKNNQQHGILFNSNDMEIDQANYNIISENSIHHNDYNGIYFISGSHYAKKGSNNIITENIISYNKGSGIVLSSWYQESNEVFKNVINNNAQDGIRTSFGKKILIYMNSFLNNQNGVSIYGGRWSNIISKNNFIDNDAKFFSYLPFPNILKIAKWRNNYWDNWEGFGVKLIPGKIELIDTYSQYLTINWFMFDLFPAKEPYDIEGVI